MCLQRMGTLLLLVVAGGCATTASTRASRSADLTILLNQAITSDESHPGQPFTATVTSALHAPDGTLLVAPGALVYGTVIETRIGARPRLVLSFDAVETTHGRARMTAQLVDAGRAARIDSGMITSAAGEFTMLYPYPYSTAYGYQYQYSVAPRAVVLPVAATLTLRVFEPLSTPR